MSIFRNAIYPWDLKKTKPTRGKTLSQLRRVPSPDMIVKPEVSGRVKWFSSNRGYGFIDTDDIDEVFVHFSSIEGTGYRILEKGDKVTFDLTKSPRGYQAINVRRNAM
jgi:CspA family cold shock protein